jgi:hypothetical protein
MVPLLSLWAPILVSAVIVFVASSIIHMVLPYHRNDLRRFAREDELLDALRRLDIAPGDYAAPHAGSPEGMRNPEFIAKMKKGPLVLMTVSPGSAPSMASNLTLWFLYTVLVSVFAAYVAGRALAPGAHYLGVFRFAGAVAFAGYSLGILQSSIWYRRNWGTTMKVVFDGLLYALLTAGTFGWLWPR